MIAARLLPSGATVFVLVRGYWVPGDFVCYWGGRSEKDETVCVRLNRSPFNGRVVYRKISDTKIQGRLFAERGQE